jgi:hypothetical protein
MAARRQLPAERRRALTALGQFSVQGQVEGLRAVDRA